MSQKPGMVECPKCGFHQPPDRYCAKCGVDMQSFKPKSSVWSNAYLQFFVAALVVICALFIVHKKAKERLEKRAQALEDIEESFASEYRPENAQAESQFAPEEIPAAAPPPIDRPSAPVKRQAPRQFQQTPASATTSAATGKKEESPKIRVTFAEVPRFHLEEIQRSGRAVSGYGNQQVAVIPQIKTVISNGRSENNLKVLAQSKTEDLVADKTISIFEGYIDEELDQKVGFTIQITPTSMEGDTMDLQIEVLREIKDYEDTAPVVTSQPFQENLRLTGAAGALMTGTLPLPRQIAEDDRAIITGTIFKIYNSEAFIEAQSDFVLFFEVVRN